ISSTVLATQAPGLEKLKIFYGDKAISTVSKHTFILINTGRTPILEKDLISPPTIIFAENSEVLDLTIEKLNPENMIVHSIIGPDNRSISINFPLLNPADSIQFTAIVSGDAPKFNVTSRIYGLRGITFVERSKEPPPYRLSWAFYVASFFAIIISLIAIPIIWEYRHGKIALRVFRLEQARFSNFTKKDDLMQFVRYEIAPHMSITRDLFYSINQLIKDDIISEEERNRINSLIRSEIESTINLNRIPFIIVLVSLIMAYIFIINSLWPLILSYF
ncbi:MAG: hypothetical protein H7Y30_15175, partial [Pyrinomonadaceae bacterium]|nr:hypothetical protein [Pyrinomonadaceae bacterium]